MGMWSSLRMATFWGSIYYVPEIILDTLMHINLITQAS